MVKHELVFGIPTQQSRNKEKFPQQAVLTMLALGEKGTARKFDLNTKGVEELGFVCEGDDLVDFAFSKDDIYFANVTEMENPSALKLTKSGTFSNKKMYDYLAKKLDLDTTTDTYLLIDNISDGCGSISILSQDGDDKIPADDTQDGDNQQEVMEEMAEAQAEYRELTEQQQ